MDFWGLLVVKRVYDMDNTTYYSLLTLYKVPLMGYMLCIGVQEPLFTMGFTFNSQTPLVGYLSYGQTINGS
jgi:hypothetical protein